MNDSKVMWKVNPCFLWLLSFSESVSKMHSSEIQLLVTSQRVLIPLLCCFFHTLAFVSFKRGRRSNKTSVLVGNLELCGIVFLRGCKRRVKKTFFWRCTCVCFLLLSLSLKYWDLFSIQAGIFGWVFVQWLIETMWWRYWGLKWLPKVFLMYPSGISFFASRRQDVWARCNRQHVIPKLFGILSTIAPDY